MIRLSPSGNRYPEPEARSQEEIPLRFKIFSAFSLIALVGAGWLSGQETASTRNAKCLACHGREARIDEKLKINEEQFSLSVHSPLDCADCHAVKEGEAQKDVPHQKDILAPDCTSSCHREDRKPQPGLDPLLYADSVHGRAYLERGTREVAKCWDCHGKHNIRASEDPDSSVYRKNIPLTCSTCHENMAVVVRYHIHSEAPYQEYMKSVHGKALFEKGLLHYAAVCTDCHGVHDIKGWANRTSWPNSPRPAAPATSSFSARTRKASTAGRLWPEMWTPRSVWIATASTESSRPKTGTLPFSARTSPIPAPRATPGPRS